MWVLKGKRGPLCDPHSVAAQYIHGKPKRNRRSGMRVKPGWQAQTAYRAASDGGD